MLELRLRTSARRDLRNIWTHTRRRSSRAQADRYLAQLRAAMQRLSTSPQLGRPLPTHPAGFERYICGSHVIFYLVTEHLDIVRVLHESMDFAARLANDEM